MSVRADRVLKTISRLPGVVKAEVESAIRRTAPEAPKREVPVKEGKKEIKKKTFIEKLKGK